MVLAADFTQDIYETARSWTDSAMTGAGFSGRWTELAVSYRMPLAACEKAAEFARQYLPEVTRIPPVSNTPELDLEPCKLRWVQLAETHTAVAKTCCDEILNVIASDERVGFSFSDLTFLTGSMALGREVVAELQALGVSCVHTYDADEQESRRQKVAFYMGDARVKATTLHSFKGWESRCLVIFVGRRTTPQSLALVYAGLTRLKRSPAGSSMTVISQAQTLSEFGRTWPEYVEVASGGAGRDLGGFIGRSQLKG
jgi:hypothetical protein